jgi:phosphatidylethanolamine/phosphatidyl-N-methylethanolamine N-methyltransferase
VLDDHGWEKWESAHAAFYSDLNYGKNSVGRIMGAGHRALENLIRPEEGFAIVLEVGVGTGEHLEYVGHHFVEYHMLDRNPDMLYLAGERHRSDRRPLHYLVGCVERLPFSDGSVDRLIATHVLEHVYKPHEVLREWNRVLKPGGAMSILIPTDPGLAWRIGRALVNRPAVQRMGLPYDYFMALEHVNPVNNLVAFLEYYFPKARRRWWPFRIASMDLNLFYAFHWSKPLRS